MPAAQGLKAWLFASLFALAGLVLTPNVPAAESLILRPPELERDVQFWIRIYTQVTTSEGVLHDEHNLGVVYTTVKFDPDVSSSERRQGLDKLRDKYRAMLKRLAQGATDLTPEEDKLRELFGVEASPARFTQAMDEIRFQLGQSDRFKAGLVRSETEPAVPGSRRSLIQSEFALQHSEALEASERR